MKTRIVIIKLRALIVRHGKCLLLQCSGQSKNYGKWECPGGKPHAHESLVDALIRETKEETGLVIRPQKYFGTSVFRKDNRDIVSIYYLCQAKGNVKVSKEHVAFAWASPQTMYYYQFTNKQHNALMMTWAKTRLKKCT